MSSPSPYPPGSPPPMVRRGPAGLAADLKRLTLLEVRELQDELGKDGITVAFGLGDPEDPEPIHGRNPDLET